MGANTASFRRLAEMITTDHERNFLTTEPARRKGLTILFTWGKYGSPNPESKYWKEFVDDVRVSILNLKPKFPKGCQNER